MFAKLKDKVCIQAWLFEQALREIGENNVDDAFINHATGQCFHPAVGIKPMIFPQSFAELGKRLRQAKTQDFYFKGVISENRQWIRKYPNTTHSLNGRNPDTKFKYDIDYFENLSRTQFGLAPIGECPWSYRFFECINCLAIPVIGDNDNDIFANRFHYYRDSEIPKNYSQTFAHENYLSFISLHTFSDYK